MQSPIFIQDLVKSYGDIQALKGVSLEVASGEIYGLIGPDGAGKTTLIRILVSLLHSDSGTVKFQGREVSDHSAFVRSNIGYMPQRFSLYRDLTVEQNLRFFGDLFKIPRPAQDEQMQRLYNFSKLEPFKSRAAGALSGGMKQKLALSCMLMHAPEVIVLDEPTFGVDPVSRNEFWDILQQLADQGITILVSTAYMDEANLCDRVGLIHQGNLLAQNRPAELLRNFGHPLFTIASGHPHETYKALVTTEYGDRLQLFGEGVHFVDRSGLGSEGIRSLLENAHIVFDGVESAEPNLENLFLELMR